MKVEEKLTHLNIRTHIDDLDESPGFKFNKWELRKGCSEHPE